jgi:hypothetical protein
MPYSRAMDVPGEDCEMTSIHAMSSRAQRGISRMREALYTHERSFAFAQDDRSLFVTLEMKFANH